ncbi:MAG: transcription elongation factor GreA [Bacteroidales bacterium]|nr:transcription elongation factor GreA [Bacteroidales bacterium]
MANVHYVTQKGWDDLKAELDELVAQRPVISKAIAEARDKGDLSENAEYDAAREAQGLLELKISKLQDLITNARIVDESNLNTDSIQMLNKVKIKNLKNNAVSEYILVGESEANFKEGKLAVSTPIGKALLGHKKGDVVDVQVPAGLLQFEVLEISL